MATGKQLKAAILARRAKGPRKKRTRPKPRQYTIAGLERAQLELSVIESQLRLRGLLGGTAIKPE